MGQFSVLDYWRSYNHFKVVALAVIVTVMVQCRPAEGLRMCYNCNTSTSGGGLECLHNPSNVTDGEVPCQGYCTLVRKDYVYMREDYSLISLQRSCELNPHKLDEVAVEGYFKIFYRSCKSYLCNVGLGIQSLRDMPVDPAWDLYTDEDLESSKGSRLMSKAHPFWNYYSISILLSFLIFSVITV